MAIILLALIAVLAWLSVVRIPGGSVGVVEAAEGEAPRILRPGFHLVAPLTRTARYAIGPASASGQVLVTPSTGGEILLRYTVSGTIDPDRFGDLMGAISGHRLEDFLSAQVASLLRQDAASRDAVEVLTPDYRARVARDISDAMMRGGLSTAEVAVLTPDDETLLAAAQALAPRGDAWKLRQTVAEAMLDPQRLKSWKLLTAMGLVNESERLFSDAERNYLDALAADPSALPPMSQLVAIYSAVGEWTKLQRVLDAALSAKPDSLQHINWVAMVLLKQNDFVGAERILKQGLAAAPGNATLLSNLGGLYLKSGRVDDAIRALEQAVAAAPSSQLALFNLGSALASVDRFAEALGYLDRAESAGSMTAPLARALSVVHDQLGNRREAASYREKAADLDGGQGSADRPDEG